MDIVTDTTTQRSDSVTNISVPRYSGVRFSASSSLPHAPVLPDPHIDEKAYCKEIAAVQSSLSFPLSKGKYNPYSGKPIQTLQDYEFYCQCVALRRIYDKKLASASAIVQSTQDVLSAADAVVMDSRRSAAMARQEAAIAKREAALYKHDAAVAKSEYAELKTRFDARKKAARLWFVVLVALLVGFFLFHAISRPAKSDPQSAPSSASNSSSHESSGVGSDRPSGYVSSEYVGNKKSHKFHRSSCSYLPDDDNRRIFKSRDAAIDAGYEPCEHCNP